ncbi:MAG: phosphoserine phosphatase SerB [Parvibaculaceae bacterium]
MDAHLAEKLGRLAGSEGKWLGEAEAVEFRVSERPSSAALADILEDRPVDYAVLPAKKRKKHLLVADMDSTMIGQECIDELGAVAGVGDKIAAITARAMTGELDFETALKQRLALMKGLAADAITRILADRISFEPGGETLLATMKKNGAYCALVSGGFSQFTRHVASHLGFDEDRANELVIAGGKLTGAAREPILGEAAKVAALLELTEKRGLGAKDSIAVGDGANDIPMLLEAGMGVALHAKPKVQAVAPIRINHGDLTALLYLQGYRKDEFVSPS